MVLLRDRGLEVADLLVEQLFRLDGLVIFIVFVALALVVIFVCHLFIFVIVSPCIVL